MLQSHRQSLRLRLKHLFMLQKIIKVGNSYAFTIPSSFVKEIGLKVGDLLNIETDPEESKLTLTKTQANPVETQEVKEWLEKFNKKYKKGLTELAKK